VEFADSQLLICVQDANWCITALKNAKSNIGLITNKYVKLLSDGINIKS